ncbi:AGAP009333-PA-like protein [Anopheles sinensis]|uniref:AGAP009333-PA-like protein n=1 Tax=Anopheles sinensis TaxID=74873 RepID=A0A084VM40_ANOSI|nr:AGAP009333-PA-like protein [Anopheles sinensis]
MMLTRNDVLNRGPGMERQMWGFSSLILGTDKDREMMDSITIDSHRVIAGTAGAVVTCPLEVVKTRLQSSSSSFIHAATAGRHAFVADGGKLTDHHVRHVSAVNNAASSASDRHHSAARHQARVCASSILTRRRPSVGVPFRVDTSFRERKRMGQ